MLLLTVAGGCTPKNVTYFQELSPEVIEQVAQVRQFRIKPEDKLTIMVFTNDDQLSRLFNLGYVNTRVTQGFPTTSGTKLKSFAGAGDSYAAYTVSADGTIDMPVLGVLNVEGMTREELAGFIKGEIQGKNLAQNVVVTVEFLNHGVDVIGEVRSPGRYDVNLNSLTLIEALSLAGDLNITADRENIMVLRQKGDKMQVYEVDLTKGKDMLTSEAYYLEPGDVVYVGPNKQRKRATTVNGNNALNASFWVSVASVLTSIAVFIFK